MENKKPGLFKETYTPIDDIDVEDVADHEQSRCGNSSGCENEREFDRIRAVLSYDNDSQRHPCVHANCSTALVISTLYFTGLLLAYTAITCSTLCHAGFGSTTYPWSTKDSTKRGKVSGLSPDRTWIWMVPVAMAAALALPFFTEALLHMPSLPVVVMLFPISFATESLLCFMFSVCSPARSDRRLSPETFCAIFTTALVLYNEYRLTVAGILFSCGAYISVGVCRASLSIASQAIADENARSKSYHEFVLMTMIYGLMFSAFGAIKFELQMLNSFPESAPRLTILLGIIFTIGACFSGTTLHVYTPVRSSSIDVVRSGVSHHMSDVVASFTVTALILLATLAIKPLAVVSWVQIASYLSAVVCLAGFSRAHNTVEDASNIARKWLQNLPYIGREITQAHSKISKCCSILTILLTTALTATLISSLSHLRLRTLSPGLPTTLDETYTPSRSSFDIVISAYSETPSSIAHMLTSIKSTSYLSTLDPRAIIYTKNPTASLPYLQEATGADIVQRLPNLGREGATFLHHIVNNWDNLAEKTMFIQAHPHNMRELLPRINSYLMPETGMLSLSFSGETCSCRNCGDYFGWRDNWSVVPSLYESVYGKECDDDTEVLLSYKGQFVASAKRIRGVRKSVYEGLLETITSESGWSHDERFVSESDSPDNPDFGFTVERVWGLLMQCAMDERVETKCPSLLSGMGWGWDVADCQCLDDVGA
ncbi:hypothetical protein ACMFMG_010309 [Clarireedia jacksonii]